MSGDAADQGLTIQRQSNSNDAAQGTDGGQSGTTGMLYGLVRAFFDGPVRIEPWHFPSGDGIQVLSQKFVAQGNVIVDTSVNTDDYELGFIQTLISSDLLAIYVDSAGTPTQTLHITPSTQPVRDGFKGQEPWAKQSDVKELTAVSATGQIAMEDRPYYVMPWKTPDGQGTLTSSSGNDAFCTWLTAQQKSTGNLQFLGWVTWSLDWGFTFDPVANVATPISAGGSVANTGDGQGPITPILTDPVAKDVSQVTWGGPP